MPKHLKKLSEEVLHENPWYTYNHDTYEKPNGEEGHYYYTQTTGVSFIVPVMQDGRILLALQYRYLKEKQSIEFPAGSIGPEDSPLEGAKRELLEETGCTATEWMKIGTFEPANGYAKDTTHAFIAYVDAQGEQVLDDTEEIELLYRRPDEIEDMIRRGDIWDGQTLATWALVRHRFLEKTQ